MSTGPKQSIAKNGPGLEISVRGRLPGTQKEQQQKRVLVAAPQPFLSDRGTPIATQFLIQALSELGWSVDLLAYPMGRDVEIPGVCLFRSCNPFGYQSVSVGFSARKIILDLPFVVQLWQLLRSGNYDAVHANEEAAYFLAQLGLPKPYAFIYDMESSIPDELASFSGLLASASRRLERQLLQRADMIICSAGLGKVIDERTADVAYREWIFPAEPPANVPPERTTALRNGLGIRSNDTVILYAGSFAGYQNATLMAGAVPKVLAKQDRVHFIFAGFADEKEKAAFAAGLGAAAGSGRVSLVDRMPRKELDPYLALADILLSCRGAVRNVPLKVFEMLVAGKPIVANQVPAHSALLNADIAMLTPSSSDGFADAILKLIEDPALAQRLGGNATAFAATHLRWSTFRSLIAGIYNDACSARDARQHAAANALTG